VLRVQGGQGMRTAFNGCCSQLLAHRFPSHPDFDPNGRGVALKPSELDVVLGWSSRRPRTRSAVTKCRATLAEAIRRNANGRLTPAKDLAAELDRHAATLGLSDDVDRQMTLRSMTALLNSKCRAWRIAASRAGSGVIRFARRWRLGRRTCR
jgi:hypothetical protein